MLQQRALACFCSSIIIFQPPVPRSTPVQDKASSALTLNALSIKQSGQQRTHMHTHTLTHTHTHTKDTQRTHKHTPLCLFHLLPHSGRGSITASGTSHPITLTHVSTSYVPSSTQQKSAAVFPPPPLSRPDPLGLIEHPAGAWCECTQGLFVPVVRQLLSLVDWVS